MLPPPHFGVNTLTLSVACYLFIIIITFRLQRPGGSVYASRRQQLPAIRWQRSRHTVTPNPPATVACTNVSRKRHQQQPPPPPRLASAVRKVRVATRMISGCVAAVDKLHVSKHACCVAAVDKLHVSEHACDQFACLQKSPFFRGPLK